MAFIAEEKATDLAVMPWSPAHSPRISAVMIAPNQHVHGFAREVHLTEEEWAASNVGGSSEIPYLYTGYDLVAQKR